MVSNYAKDIVMQITQLFEIERYGQVILLIIINKHTVMK